MDVAKFIEVLTKKVDEGLELLPEKTIGTEEYNGLMESMVKTINVINTLLGNGAEEPEQEFDEGQEADDTVSRAMIRVGERYESYKGDVM